MCLKVVNSTVQPVTIGNAMVACSLDNARLVALQSCIQLTNMVSGIYNQFLMDNQTYFVGLSTYTSPNGISYRNCESLTVIDS